jgi:hypothetical protein
MPLDHGLAVLIGDGHPLAHAGAVDGIFQNNAVLHEADRVEAAHGFRKRATSYFLRTGSRFARVNQ